MVELIRNAKLTIDTSTVVISEEQSLPNQRSVILIQNTSTGGQKITISPSDQATLGVGIVISSGGYYQDTLDSGYTPTNQRITAISDIAGGTISIHERIIMRQ